MMNLWLIISIAAIIIDIGVIGCNIVIYRQLKEIEEELQVLLQIGEKSMEIFILTIVAFTTVVASTICILDSIYRDKESKKNLF